LGAGKLTGKIGKNINVGGIYALTGRETGTFSLNGEQFKQEIEPRTHFGVLRLQKEMDDSRYGLGFISTFVGRDFETMSLKKDLNSSAGTFGLDGWAFLDKEKTWVVSSWFGGTHVTGSQERIQDLQRSSSHYFQRPDADHIAFDNTATSLSGLGGRVLLNKQKGNMLLNTALGFITPGFDVNDMGFMFRTDVINGHVGIGYKWTEPNKWHRDVMVIGAVFQSQTFGGDVTSRGIWGLLEYELPNYHRFEMRASRNPQVDDVRLTRGGPVAKSPAGTEVALSYSTAPSKPFVFELGGFLWDTETSEQAKGKNKIGSTLKGIGPTYMDKTGRNGLRVGDIELDDFNDRYNQLVTKHKQILSHYPDFEYDLESKEQEWFAAVDFLRDLTLIDSEHYVNSALKEGRTILAEGAQGSLLDIDFGSYPFVTSSTTMCAGSCTGLGIAPNRIQKVYGIFKAYCTRVGSGPFPTELHDETGEELRKKGHEFGATTGRPRRCGWLDLPALRYAIDINGVTNLIMMKSDVLSGFEKINVCTSYRYKGTEIDHLPYSIEEGLIEPIYTELEGWKEDITSLDNYEDAPRELKNYVSFLQKELGVPITIISVGPDRSQTIHLEESAVV